MRASGMFRQLLSATLCAVLGAPAYPSESTLPRTISTASHTYDAETLSKTRVWGSNEKILLHFRATLLLSEKQHWGYEKCRWKNVVGSVVTYDYDAFGNLIHSTGTTPNNYLFAGEQFDPDLNLYYNRARYLNVSTGRFWNMDTTDGESSDPASLHKYLYASADPENRFDPSGHDDLVTTLGAAANTITIVALSSFNIRLAFALVQGQTGIAALDSAAKAGLLGAAAATPIIGPYVQALLIAGAVNASLTGQLKPIDYAELATYIVVGYSLGYFGGSGAAATPEVAPAEGGIVLRLRYKPEWGPAERAFAEAKVQALNDAATSTELVSTDPVRVGRTARTLYTSAGNATPPPGFDVDHIIDLQLNGANSAENRQLLPATVNRSLGAQIGNALGNLPRGTRVTGVTIQ